MNGQYRKRHDKGGPKPVRRQDFNHAKQEETHGSRWLH